MDELKKKNIQASMTYFLSGVIMIFFLMALNSYNHTLKQSNSKSRQIENLKDSLSYSNNRYHKLEHSIWLKDVMKHNYVYDVFREYNPKINDCTIESFIKVIEFYSLDSTKQMFNTCISQIIHESGAKHTRRGQVTESSGHAMGLTQIVPTTGFHFLRGVLTKSDKKDLYALGCTNFEFVYDYRLYDRVKEDGTHVINQHARSLVKEWLKDESNNIALWGYITKYELENRNYNIDHFLLAYNRGGGFLNQWIRSGKQPRHYPYVRVINGMARQLGEAELDA